MQLLELAGLRLGLAGEDFGHALERLPLPDVDMGLMHAVLDHQIGDCQLATNGLKLKLPFELGAVNPSFASRAFLPRIVSGKLPRLSDVLGLLQIGTTCIGSRVI